VDLGAHDTGVLLRARRVRDCLAHFVEFVERSLEDVLFLCLAEVDAFSVRQLLAGIESQRGVRRNPANTPACGAGEVHIFAPELPIGFAE